MKRALTISEAAKYACVSRGTVYNWINEGNLPHESLPGRSGKPVLRVRFSDLQAFLERNYKSKHNQQTEQQEILLLPMNSER